MAKLPTEGGKKLIFLNNLYKWLHPIFKNSKYVFVTEGKTRVVQSPISDFISLNNVPQVVIIKKCQLDCQMQNHF